MYLVVYSVKSPSGHTVDHYVACETMTEAENEYQVLVNQDTVWSASICGVIKSTDYDRVL
jgi:hypothetical protein